MASFDENGKYIKTNWKAGDKITSTKLNKIEESIEAVNDNDISRHVEADARLDALEAKDVAHDKELTKIKNDIADNKAAAELGDYDINSRMQFLEQEFNEGIEEVHNVADTVDGKIAKAESDMTNAVNTAKNEMAAQVNAAQAEMTIQVNTAQANMTAQVDTAKEEMEAMVAEVEADLEEILKKINPTGNADTDTKNLKELSGTYAILGEGIFLVNDTIEWHENTNIKGLGIGSTTIKLADNSNKCMIRFLDAPKSSLSDVLLDGNFSGNTLSMVDTETGLLEIKTTVNTTLFSDHLNIRNLSIINAPNNGISLFGKSDTSGYNWIFNIDSVKIHRAKKYCWYDDTSDNHFSNLSLSGGRYADLYCSGGSNMYSNLKCDGEAGSISDGLDDTIKGACVILNTSSNIRFSNLDVQSGYYAGVKIFNSKYIYLQGDINNCGTAYTNKDEKLGVGLYMRNSMGIDGLITTYPIHVNDLQKYPYDMDYTNSHINIHFNVLGYNMYTHTNYITKNSALLSYEESTKILHEKYKNESLMYMMSHNNTDGLKTIQSKNIDYRGIKCLFDPDNFDGDDWNSLVGEIIAEKSANLKTVNSTDGCVLFRDSNDYMVFNPGISTNEYTVTFDISIDSDTITEYTEIFKLGYGTDTGSIIWLYPNGMYAQVKSTDGTYNKLFASSDILIPLKLNERHRFTFSVKMMSDYAICSVYLDDELVKCGGIPLEADCSLSSDLRAMFRFPVTTRVYGLYLSDRYIGY